MFTAKLVVISQPRSVSESTSEKADCVYMYYTSVSLLLGVGIKVLSLINSSIFSCYASEAVSYVAKILKTCDHGWYSPF